MIGTYKQQQKKKHEPWRNNSRYYCVACNTWMGNDRQSILIHENGQKHKENVEKNLSQQRNQRTAKDAAARALQNTLKQINSAALSSHCQDVSRYGDSALNSYQVEIKQEAVTEVAEKKLEEEKKEEKKKRLEEWKKKREAEAKEKVKTEEEEEIKQTRRELAPDEGHYTLGSKIYLEGVSFVELLEEEMPMEVWVGPATANLAEKRLPEKQHQWRTGLVLKIRKSLKEEETGKVLDVAYVKDANADEEIIEKSVPPNRIRLILGSDVSIPDTLEEARIAAVGGHVVTREENVKLEVDESTGLSGWGTVEVRKTTVRQEVKEERERARKKRREEIARQEEESKRAEGRRMEEARVENADDSALGAYDVWNAGKAGYKGVNINTEEKMTTAEVRGTSLSGGKKVGFKKKGKKKGNKRRRTSADDL